MKKSFFNSFLAVIIVLICLNIDCTVCASSVNLLQVMNEKAVVQNPFWTSSFQILWNEFSDNFSANAVELSKDIKNLEFLNQKYFVVNDLPVNSVYKKFGLMNENTVPNIEAELHNKFDVQSVLLKRINSSNVLDKYFLYTMVKKNFVFDTSFTELKKDYFGKNKKQKVRYFGIDSSSTLSQRDNVRIVYYFSPNDFALKILSGDDEIILFKTVSDKNFEFLYKTLKNKTYKYEGSNYITGRDEVKIPEIVFFQEKLFSEFYDTCSKNIPGLKIGVAVETIDFSFKNSGKKQNRNALIASQMSIYYPDTTPQRNFYFDNKFVIFVKDKNRELPYIAMRVDDVANMNKSGKN